VAGAFAPRQMAVPGSAQRTTRRSASSPTLTETRAATGHSGIGSPSYLCFRAASTSRRPGNSTVLLHAIPARRVSPGVKRNHAESRSGEDTRGRQILVTEDREGQCAGAQHVSGDLDDVVVRKLHHARDIGIQERGPVLAHHGRAPLGRGHQHLTAPDGPVDPAGAARRGWRVRRSSASSCRGSQWLWSGFPCRTCRLEGVRRRDRRAPRGAGRGVRTTRRA